MKQHKNAVASAADGAGTSSGPNSRKRSAPSSSGKKSTGNAAARTPGGRANQPTAQMAVAAYARDNGGDDDEEDLDVKPARPAKRVKSDPAAGLHGQIFDLTRDGNDDEVQITQVNHFKRHSTPRAKAEIKQEASVSLQNRNIPSFYDVNRLSRERR